MKINCFFEFVKPKSTFCIKVSTLYGYGSWRGWHHNRNKNKFIEREKCNMGLKKTQWIFEGISICFQLLSHFVAIQLVLFFLSSSLSSKKIHATCLLWYDSRLILLWFYFIFFYFNDLSFTHVTCFRIIEWFPLQLMLLVNFLCLCLYKLI